MADPTNDTIGSSRGNSLSAGDPKIASEGNTSTDSTSNKNSGESAPQTGENIVNEQEQNKSVNMEEFVENTAQNRFEEGDDINAGTNNPLEESDNTDETANKVPTMTGGAL